MPRLALAPSPPRSQLLAQIRGRLGDLVPGLQLAAEGILGADAPIDFVAVEPDGCTLLVLVGEEGNDLELLARGLAQRAWVEARLGDWLQLAPGLGVRPEIGARVLLLCPSFQSATQTAARALGGRAVALACYRCVRNGRSALEVLLESAERDGPQGPADVRTPAAPSSFRTGLSDADLGLTVEEQREFE